MFHLNDLIINIWKYYVKNDGDRLESLLECIFFFAHTKSDNVLRMSTDVNVTNDGVYTSIPIFTQYNPKH